MKSGIIDSQNESLHELIEKDPETAVQKIRSARSTDELRQRDKSGLEPIHWAAKLGRDKVFRVLVKQGLSPFTPDANGYSPYYHARALADNKIMELFQSFKLLQREQDLWPIDAIDQALLDCGFHPYSIKPLTNWDAEFFDKTELTGLFLTELLQKGEIPSYFEKSSEKSEKSSADEILTLVDSAYLTQVAAGIIEAIAPEHVVAHLTGIYPALEWEQKMACIYLVKELIRLDKEKEWTSTDDFRAQMRLFTDVMDNVAALKKIKAQLRSADPDQIKFQHVESVEYLAVDLTKAFREAVLSLTPEKFLAKNLDDGQKAFTDLTNQVTYMVCMDIVGAETSADAAKIMGFYIDTIGACLLESKKRHPLMTHNFAAGLAIYNGLKMDPISRLKGAYDLLSEEHKTCLSRYDVLFDSKGGYSAIRKAISALPFPLYIPPLPLYTADKDKARENTFVGRVQTLGAANSSFYRSREYLATLPCERFCTDLMESLPSPGNTKLIGEKAAKRSCLIEPPRIIELHKDLSLDDVIKILKFCISTNAPLFARENGVLFQSSKAKAQIAAYLREHFGMKVTTPSNVSPEDVKMRDIIDLCGQVIVTFDDFAKDPQEVSLDIRIKMMKAYQLKKPKPQRQTRESFTDDSVPKTALERARQQQLLELPRPTTVREERVPGEKELAIKNKRKKLLVKTSALTTGLPRHSAATSSPAQGSYLPSGGPAAQSSPQLQTSGSSKRVPDGETKETKDKPKK